MSLRSALKTNPGLDKRVTVQAPARLHMGFLDLHGGLGRRFGSIGLALNSPRTEIVLRAANGWSARGPDSERALAHAREICSVWGLSGRVDIEVNAAIPSHAGLGSGTQLCLALIEGVARLFDVEANLTQTAEQLGRGARSGIGVGAFATGGFLIDGGRGKDAGTPPIVVRAAFPDEWRLLLVLDGTKQGVHGVEEKTAFARLPAFAAREAERLCRLTLMQMLPALVEADIARFGDAITEVQRCLGSHFADVQGGPYSSAAVADAMSELLCSGAAGVGQSSWGPTGFALFESEGTARRALEDLRCRGAASEGLDFRLCRARNTPVRAECELDREDGAVNRAARSEAPWVKVS